jgi:hypothetical protein
VYEQGPGPDFERRANGLKGTLSRAMRKVASAKMGGEVGLPSAEQSSNCVGCRVERISLTRDTPVVAHLLSVFWAGDDVSERHNEGVLVLGLARRTRVAEIVD